MISAALAYHELCLSVIPLKNEDKKPLFEWGAYEKSLIKPDHRYQDAYGLGVVCGEVSGNLEALDVDMKYSLDPEMFNKFKALVHEQDKSLLTKLVVAKTAKNGYHLIYRCSQIGGNLKLAKRPTTEKDKNLTYERTYAKVRELGNSDEICKEKAEKAAKNDKLKDLFETRGEGGFIACYPTPKYSFMYGDFSKIQEITTQQRDILLNTARSFNEVYEEVRPSKAPPKLQSSGLSPWDDWNQRGDIPAFLEDHGWRFIKSMGNGRNYYLRPGGTAEWSADFHEDKRLFYVWTSSTEFEPSKAYNGSAVVAYLKFNRDFSAAGKWLYEQGYGDRFTPKDNEPKTQIEETDSFDYIVSHDEMDKILIKWRNGTFQMGRTTGIPSLDKHYLFKQGNFVIINGKDNVGKTILKMYLLLLQSMLHNSKWIIYSNENNPANLVKRLIEFYYGKGIALITNTEYLAGKKFIHDHFVFVSNNFILNYKDIISIANKMMNKESFAGMLIDPYNSLKIDLPTNSKLSTHEYHYEAASEMQIFTKKYNFSMFLNCHVVTSAARDEKAPGKADTEGGSKFPNKADDFITLHRYPHSENWRDIEIHVRKIKELETGGSYTYEANPYKLKMIEGQCGYTDQNGFNPIADYWQKTTGQIIIPIQPEINIGGKKRTEPEFDDPFDIGPAPF